LLLTKLTIAPASSNPSTTKELATKWLMNPNLREDYKSRGKKNFNAHKV